MKHKFPAATIRRKDYITFLAVILFVMVVACEILLVVWLPRKLHSEIMWQDQIAKEEMIELEDLLRAYMIDMKSKYREITGELELVQDLLAIEGHGTVVHIDVAVVFLRQVAPA